MGSVQILSDSLVAKIAAGEIIERPASVVKELVENALDAGARRVHVRVHEGGARGVSVRDDGSGMSERDARLAFRRHATSKIHDLEDLFAVSTLGFRGEGLASIAAVARVRMQTRRAEDALGVQLALEGSTPLQVAPVSCSVGTAVEVGELFEWVPARRKFLKSPATESLHILRWVEEIALARSDVHFELERDGRPSLTLLPTRDLGERVRAVLPSKLGDGLVPLEQRAGNLGVAGYASPTNLMRPSAQDIHLFVNGRPVRERVLLSAVREAYRDALPSGKHPVVVLFLDVPPGEVDVNVHPSKVEVRFREPNAVHAALRQAIRAGVGAPSARAGRAPGPPARTWEPAGLHLTPAVPATPPSSAAGGGSPGAEAKHVGERAAIPWLPAGPGAQSPPATAQPARAPGWELGTSGLLEELRDSRFVGQMFSTYLVLEREGAVVVLDQHEAHERVLFDDLRLRALAGQRLERQVLLFPAWLDLARASAEALWAERTLLEHLGFELEEGAPTLEGQERLALRAVPALLRTRAGADLDYAAMLEETAAGLIDPAGREKRDGIDGAVHHVLATAACHSAVRRGVPMSAEQVRALVRSLDAGIEFPNCPHGRPIAWVLAEKDLARHFLRPLG